MVLISVRARWPQGLWRLKGLHQLQKKRNKSLINSLLTRVTLKMEVVSSPKFIVKILLYDVEFQKTSISDIAVKTVFFEL
jgi:hypothetical protein